MKYKQCISYLYDKCDKANEADCDFDTCKIRLEKEKKIIENILKI